MTTRKFSFLKAATVVALMAPLPALADPFSIIGALVYYVSGSAIAYFAIVLGGAAYNNAQARKKQRQANAAAKAAYNQSLQDQSISALSAQPFWRIVYGRKIVGGDVVDIITTDKTGYNENGTTYTKPDAYKHIVIEIAHHQVQAIHGALIDGEPVGPLDGNGFPTGGAFYSAREDSRLTVIGGSGFIDVGQAVTTVISATAEQGFGEYAVPVDVTGSITLTNGNTRINGPVNAWVNYRVDASLKSVRLQFHLGDPSQTVDTFLNGLVATHWTTAHRLRGRAYAVLTLDLEDVRFQGGLPNPTFDVSGRLCFDPRTSTTAWTDNPAVCIRDWLLAPWGYAISTADIDDAYTIAAANACDARVSTTTHNHSSTVTASAANNTVTAETRMWLAVGDGVRFTTTGSLPSPLAAGTTYYVIETSVRDVYQLATSIANAKAGTAIDITSAGSGTHTMSFFDMAAYTLNGGINAGESKEVVLSKMAAAMAGDCVNSGYWVMWAGAWTATVMDILPDDLAGVIELPHADTDYGELFNGIRGSFVPRASTSTAQEVYANSTFVTADGGALWDAQEFRFTDNRARVRNIERILTEQNRNGQVIRVPAKLKAWGVQIGDRVRVTSLDLSVTLKEYRVTDWEFDIGSVVWLTCREDAASTYDLADAITDDPTPNSDLVSPFGLTQLSGISGSTVMLRLPDGTAVPRVTVSFTQSPDPFIKDGSGRIVLLWRLANGTTWNRIEVTGDATSVSFTGPREGEMLVIELFPLSSNREPGPSAFFAYTVPTISPTSSNTNVSLVSYGTTGAAIQGNTVTKTGASGSFDAAVRSINGIIGPCIMSAIASATNTDKFFGLTSNPTAVVAPSDIEYGFYLTAAGVYAIYENNTAVTSSFAYSDGDVFEITYTGSSVQYRKNGALLRTIGAASNKTLYFDSSLVTQGAQIRGIAFGPATEAPRGNLVDSSSWALGSTGDQGIAGTNSRFAANGGASENSIITGLAPDRVLRTLWKGLSTDVVASTGDGGWDMSQGSLPVDPTKLYRISVWIKANVQTGSDFGAFYLGPGNDSGVADISTGTPNANPYFFASARSQLAQNRWYLLVGFVLPHAFGTTPPSPSLSGIYDGATGQRIAGGNDFKWVSTTKASSMRAYQYYADTNNEQLFWGPRFEMCDGTEPTIQELLAPALASYSTIYDNAFDASYGLNGSFSRWAFGSAYPDNWSIWANASGITREVTAVADGPNAVRMVTGGSNTGILWNLDLRSAARWVTGAYLEVTVNAYIADNISGSGYPGVLIRLYTNSGLTTYRDTLITFDKTAGGWQPITANAAVNQGEVIYYVTIFLMGSYSLLFSGSWDGIIIFDAVEVKVKYPKGTTQLVDGSVLGGVTTGASGTLHTWSNVNTLQSFPSSGSDPIAGFATVTHASRQSYLVDIWTEIFAKSTVALTHLNIQIRLQYRNVTDGGSLITLQYGGTISAIHTWHPPGTPYELGAANDRIFTTNDHFTFYINGPALMTDGKQYAIGVAIDVVPYVNQTATAPGASSLIGTTCYSRVITRLA